MACLRFSATQLAIIAAIVMVGADIIGLIAALAAYDEEQESKKTEKADIENQIRYLQGRLKYYK